MDVDFHAVAFDGTCLYRLARLVSATSQLDMEGADTGADDGSVSAVVYRLLADDRPDADAFGDCSLRDRHIEHYYPALSLYAVPGARPGETAAPAASYLIL